MNHYPRISRPVAVRPRRLPLWLALGALALGAVGLCAQDAGATPEPTRPPMKQFVILFRQGPHPLTGADKARRQAAVSAWAREVNAAGHKLDPRILATESANPGVVAPPEARGSWPVTALLFLEARDLDEVARIAGAHPAKDFNARVEVRAWAPPPVPRP